LLEGHPGSHRLVRVLAGAVCDGKVVERETGHRADRTTVLAFILADRGTVRMIGDAAERSTLSHRPIGAPEPVRAGERVPTALPAHGGESRVRE